MIYNYNNRGCPHVRYDGVDLSEVFAVADVDIPALPPIEVLTMDLAQRAGSYYMGRRIGPRTLSVRLRVEADNRCPLDVYKAWREGAGLVCKGSPKPLQLDEELSIDAILTGESAIEREGRWGTVEATFLALDPYFHGRRHAVELDRNGSSFAVVGEEVAPVVEARATASTVTVTNRVTGEFVRVPTIVGKELTIDMDAQMARTSQGFAPCDLASDFFTVSGSACVAIEGATGHLVYRERFL